MKKMNGLILAGITALSLCGFVLVAKPYEEKKPAIAHAASYYTITINANGGSVPYVGCLEKMYYQPSDGKFYDHLHAKTGEPAGEMTVGEEFTAHYRDGYLLQGYYTAATGGSLRLKGRSNTNWNYLSLDQSFVDNKPTGNMTVYARWKAREFDVTLDKQGGTGGTSSIKTTYDAAMPSITVPTKAGYSFDGYYDATSGGTKYYNANGSSARTWNKAPDITISLYARWTAATYTVTFDHQGGTSSLTTKTVTYNAAMPAISSSQLPTKTAHRFDGYYDAAEGGTKYYNANGSSAKKWNKTSNATLYAHWTLLSYTVTLNQQNGTGGLSSVTAVYSQDMPTIEQANLPTREGATFGGYFAQAKGQGKQYYSDSGTSVNTWDKTSAATIYAYWIPGEEAQAVIDLIDNIGTVSYPGSKDDITAARNAYNSLSDALKSIVDDYNYATLTAAEAQYESLKQAGANAVIAKIEAIGEVSYPESGSKIDDARTSYEALTDEQKALVTNLATLEAAEAEYLAQRDAQIQAVEDEINALPEITTSNFVSYKPLVESARGHYNALTDEQKGLFDADVLASLVAKEELIATYEGEKAAGLAVKDLIDAIGEVSYPGSKDAIEGARTAYNALKNDHERSYVDNLDVLLDAEAEYKSLKQAGANAVKDLIDAIGEVEYSAESKGKIDAARAAYEALTDEQKALVTNYATLTHDEGVYNHVDQVVAKINSIGAVTLDSGTAINSARTAYDNLTDEEEALVPNLATLEAAEARYAELVEAKAEADAVVAKIEAIGEVSYPESGIKIDDARTSYDALNSDGKSFVTNLATLEAAEAEYLAQRDAQIQAVEDEINALPEITTSNFVSDKPLVVSARDHYNALTDEQKGLFGADVLASLVAKEELIATYEGEKAAGLAVKDLIDAIGEVSYPGSKDDIEGARTAYNALKNEHERSYVDNLDVLIAAEARYEELKVEGANAVKDLIDAIGEVEYSAESKGKIDAARTAYDALTDEQKALVTNYATLTAAEARYAELVEAKAEADAVIAKIEAIGEVSYPESGSKIDDARTSYDALNSDGKSFVTNLATLEAAEDRYEELKVEGANAVKDLIDSIGNVEYSEESKDKIDAARAAYDALTEEQKELISNKELQVLINAETEYSKIQKNANILVIVLLIVACLTIAGGIWFLFFLLKKKRKDDDDNDENKGKGKPVKAMSVGGFLPGVILISHYLGAPYIALYVLAGVAVLLWISILVIVIMKKKQVGPFKKKAIVAKEEPQTATTQNEDEEVETVSDEKGNIFQIKYIKSFTAKLIQSPEETKKYYEELKNEVLSYKKTNSRVSWHYDAVNSGREYVLKFAIRGKTLCVYLPLDPEKLEEKYKVEKSESKKFEDVPCLYRIKNDRRCQYTKELIALVASNLGLEKGEEQHEVYSNLPYEQNKPLVARGLIKEQKIQVNKPIEQQVLETKVSSDGDEIVVTKDEKGNIFEIRYIKSFIAKLSQSEKEVKDYYTVLKNYALSYKDAHSRVSWHYDAINVGREYVMKFSIRGKTLCVYFALDASKLDEKYKVEEAKGKKFEEVPTLYRIKNDRRCEYAKELIDEVMKKAGASQGEIPAENYVIPHESTKALLAKGLIKELKTAVKKPEVHHIDHLVASVSVDEADKLMSDEDAEVMIEEDKSSKKHEGKKAIVNIDELEANFNDGDKITLETLQEKKLIAKDVGRVKLLARGQLDKKLDVHLQEYSIQAVKMILLVGGKVQKAK